MARVLIVGAGSCRALALTRELTAEGHAVRGVTRGAHRDAIEAAGGEPWIGDPDVIGTLRYALANVTVLVWALGTVDAPELHGSRLEMMLERTVDTMVRGVVYERGGGEELVERMCKRNEVPYVFVDPAAPDEWATAVRAAIDGLLTAERPRVHY